MLFCTQKKIQPRWRFSIRFIDNSVGLQLRPTKNQRCSENNMQVYVKLLSFQQIISHLLLLVFLLAATAITRRVIQFNLFAPYHTHIYRQKREKKYTSLHIECYCCENGKLCFKSLAGIVDRQHIRFSAVSKFGSIINQPGLDPECMRPQIGRSEIRCFCFCWTSSVFQYSSEISLYATSLFACLYNLMNFYQPTSFVFPIVNWSNPTRYSPVNLMKSL